MKLSIHLHFEIISGEDHSAVMLMRHQRHLPMVQTWQTAGARSAWADLRCAIQFSLAGTTVAQNGQRKLVLGRALAALLPGGAASPLPALTGLG